MFDIYVGGLLLQEDDLFFLRKFCEYNNDLNGEDMHFNYINKKLPDLNSYLPSDLFNVQLNSSFETMKKIMLWVHNFLIPDGTVTPIRPFNCLNIINKTLQCKIKSNCWMFAVVLNEIFLSMGYKSRMVRCMPFDLRFNDCHCVVQAYSNEYKKWILFDPAFGTYYMNSSKIPINLREFRMAIINDEKVLTPFVPAKKSKTLLQYWIKNLFRFESYALSKFNIESIEEDITIYSLLPVGYELLNKEFIHNNHIIKVVYTHNEYAFWEE